MALPLKVIQLGSDRANALALSAAVFGGTIAAAQAARDTQIEIDSAQAVPQVSPQRTMAQERQAFMRARTGPPFIPFEAEGETFYVRRLSYGWTLYLSLLMPLNELGFLDVKRPAEIAFLMAETLRLGLCVDDAGTPYFENRADSAAYVDDDATNDFAAVVLQNIDAVNNLFPKRAQPTAAQKRLSKLREAKPRDSKPKAPKSAGTAPTPEQIKDAVLSAASPNKGAK